MTKNLFKDLFIALMSLIGIYCFMIGDFAISTMLFGLASISSNLESKVVVRA